MAPERALVLFNSTEFLVFLIATVFIHYSLPMVFRRYFLLLASYVFYWFWDFELSLLLVASTVVDYLAARVISSAGSGPSGSARKRLALIASICFNLGILVVFKYADFFSGSAADLFGVRPWPVLDLVLPLGISFYTFQTMSYTIDVYRGKIDAFHDPIDVALYVSFFPQLVAGPIVRADVLVPQIHQAHTLNPVWLRAGIALIAWGLVKKVVFADSMAPIVNEAYAGADIMSGVALLTATYAFAAQIYFDFSGYTDIAIGSALLLGVKLPKNFDSPYLSCSIGEFWRRWHISLSTWLRDYLYISLGGNKKGPSRTYFNLMITMVLGGLWHGAGWNWVVWGVFHGGLLVIERALGLSQKISAYLGIRLLQWFVTFHLVCISWIFFRAADFDQATTVISRIATMEQGLSFSIYWPLIVMALLIFVECTKLRGKWIAAIERSPRMALVTVIVVCVVFPLIYRGVERVEFIYFQF